MLTQNKQRTEKLAVTAILAALVIVLQVIADVLSSFGPFSVSFTLALTPIILGAILYGPRTGALLGLVWGIYVAIFTMIGTLPAYVGPNQMFHAEYRHTLTIFLCLFKGVAAGFVAGLVYLPFKKKGNLLPGVFVASAVCPIVNTFIFCSMLLLFYRDVAIGWKTDDYPNLFVYVLLGVAGLNFVIEFISNLALAPGIERIIYAVRKRN